MLKPLALSFTSSDPTTRTTQRKRWSNLFLALFLLSNKRHLLIVYGWSSVPVSTSRHRELVTLNKQFALISSFAHPFQLSSTPTARTKRCDLFRPSHTGGNTKNENSVFSRILLSRFSSSSSTSSLSSLSSKDSPESEIDDIIFSNNHSPPQVDVVDVNLLRSENSLLRETIRKLEEENQVLKQRSAGRIVLENFEGERFFRNRMMYDDDDDDGELQVDRNYNTIDEMDGATSMIGEFGDMSSLPSSPSSQSRNGITLTGEELSSDIEQELWCDVLDGDECPVEPTISFGEALRDRAYWLVGLLIMQSLSGFILSRNEALLANHPVIIYFLTMMVGAGGNAGNQASVRVIRGLALGTLNDRTRGQFLTREIKMAASLSLILSLAGFCRAIAFRTPLPEAITVTAALALIVFSSVCLGAVLPLFLEWAGVDPAHSSTTIQVIMDILGVLLAVVVSRAILDGPLGVYILGKLGAI